MQIGLERLVDVLQLVVVRHQLAHGINALLQHPHGPDDLTLVVGGRTDALRRVDDGALDPREHLVGVRGLVPAILPTDRRWHVEYRRVTGNRNGISSR